MIGSHPTGMSDESGSLAVLERPPSPADEREAPTPVIRVLVACEHAILREGLVSLIGRDAGLSVVSEATELDAVVQQILALHPDILLIEAPFGHLSGHSVLMHLGSHPRLTALPRIIVLAEDVARFQVCEMLERGARGIVEKTAAPSVLIKAIRCVAAGQFWVERELLARWIQGRKDSHGRGELSETERVILNEVLAGKSCRAIAGVCGITESSVQRRLASLYRKFGVSGRLELAVYAAKHHL